MKGIIPARAGFTHPFCFPIYYLGDHPRSRGVYPSCPNGWGRRGGDHPRSRGVYSVISVDPRESGGSSPLARGLLLAKNFRRQDVRIIPARAGFTSPPPRRRPSHWDHPRSRGVYDISGSPPGRSWGSSPLARGLPVGAGVLLEERRIIPARAGFTRHRVG